MMKKIALGLLALCSASFAANAEAMLSNQKKAAFPDTAEIRMRTTIAIQGMPQQTVESRLLSKGKEKNIAEIKSPLIGMKIVRNGEQVSVTDLKTGATLPAQMAAKAGMPDISQGMGEAADYKAPVKEGKLWRLEPVDVGGATLFYSDEAKRVVKMRQTVQGAQTETSIKYCAKECELPGTPAEIEITTQAGGQAAAKVSIEIISAKKIGYIPDALFEIQKK